MIEGPTARTPGVAAPHLDAGAVLSAPQLSQCASSMRRRQGARVHHDRVEALPTTTQQPAWVPGGLLLIPDIVEAILDGTHDPDLTLYQLMKPFPVKWERQERSGSFAPHFSR